MGLFSRFFEKRKLQILTNDFRVLNGYTPAFTTYNGGLYEMEVIRSVISSISNHCSKLNPVINGNNKHKKLSKILQTKPNKLMTMQQFLEKLVNILLIENNAYIVPIYSDYYESNIVGLYPIRSIDAKIIKYEDVDYLVYKIGNEEFATEYEKVGHLRNNFYSKDYLADGNSPLRNTLDLINLQNQGVKEGIKKGASIRFLARLTNTIAPEHLKKERQALTEANLGIDNSGGIMIFDNKYSDVKEISSKPFIIDNEQMKNINNNIFNYFHISEEILQNKANEDEWNAFYEGRIEPISLQISQVLTNMLFTDKELEKGYGVTFESSRLQFASNKTKLDFTTQMFDRGQLTINQSLSIWNLPPVIDGDKRYIRKEYTEVNNLDKEVIEDDKTS